MPPDRLRSELADEHAAWQHGQGHVLGHAVNAPQPVDDLELQAVFDQALRVVLGQTLARSVLATQSQVRSLERAAIAFQLDALPADGPQRLLPNTLERELPHSALSCLRAAANSLRFAGPTTG